MIDSAVEVIERFIGEPCGRCNGKGTERHQVSRDPKDGYDEHPCPSCQGAARTVIHASPLVVARWVLTALNDAGYDIVERAGLTNNTGSPNGLQRET